MNLNEAVNNINQVLFAGRIEMPNGPLTSQEHQQLAADLSLLISRAQLADKQEIEIANLKGEIVELAHDVRQAKKDVPKTLRDLKMGTAAAGDVLEIDGKGNIVSEE